MVTLIRGRYQRGGGRMYLLFTFMRDGKVCESYINLMPCASVTSAPYHVQATEQSPSGDDALFLT